MLRAGNIVPFGEVDRMLLNVTALLQSLPGMQFEQMAFYRGSFVDFLSYKFYNENMNNAN